MTRRHRLWLLATALFLLFISVTYLGRYTDRSRFRITRTNIPFVEPPSWHPITQQMFEKQRLHDEQVARQSKNLEQAVKEYQRRYQLPPPPKFDEWYAFAAGRNVTLIDEYDSIHDSLLPFWAVPPHVIRARAREALGFENSLLGAYIRDGKIVTVSGGTEWQQKATAGMLEPFVRHLPAMDLAFNTHDEPRVLLQSDDLHLLVQKGRQAMPAVPGKEKPVNQFSPKPNDINDGNERYSVPTTRFNVYAHQAVWTESRMSCPPDSRARDMDETAADDTSAFTTTELGFITNTTAFSDICQSPSLRDRFGFFDRPNAFDVVHDLFPIFSQSKLSNFQDILYPSPWYWVEKVPYREADDMLWKKKLNQMHWRGSTTGGFSRNGGWKRQHRQRMVDLLSQTGNVSIFLNDSSPSKQYNMQQVPAKTFQSMMDVHFSHIGQCDPSDCDAQREHFEVVKEEKQHQVWQYQHILDMDGNAFSGRFYAFLKSNSLVYKMAIFREWHEMLIKPWVHYIPLSLQGDEYYEIIRFFSSQDGQKAGWDIAMASKDWANRSLRKEDFEVWFFRLLIEYGRVIDDNRTMIGFSL